MLKSATEVLQDAIFSAVLDSIQSIKDNANGMPNTLLRELNALHGNATFADLPAHLQGKIKASVSETLNRLRKEGYVVSAPSLTTQRPQPPQPRKVRRP